MMRDGKECKNNVQDGVKRNKNKRVYKNLGEWCYEVHFRFYEKNRAYC